VSEHVVLYIHHLHLAHQIPFEFVAETVIVNREYSLGVLEKRIVLVSGLQVEGNEARDPIVAMNDVRCPSQFPDSLDHSLAKEDRTLIVVFVEFVFLIVEHGLPVEIVFVVDKVYLKLCIGIEATLIISGFSSSPTEMLMPDRRTTSCSLFFLSLINPNRGTRMRISIPFSCIAWGSFRTNSATSLVCRKGFISLAT